MAENFGAMMSGLMKGVGGIGSGTGDAAEGLGKTAQGAGTMAQGLGNAVGAIGNRIGRLVYNPDAIRRKEELRNLMHQRKLRKMQQTPYTPSDSRQ